MDGGSNIGECPDTAACSGAVARPNTFELLASRLVAWSKVHIREVPPYSVVVPGSLPGKPLPGGEPGRALACAVIVKQVDERTRSKTSINELLRD